ncbi:MAG: hypothetical protein KDD73_11195 [Anaerolineales bacterium]|nr:hypothetical protein [Anaerolineales bacterium]MCB9127365.1 hypothetical protein [Ardenticatenales bacterium]MCB9172700.1 hypothetical protein [Ardenticatenales bacterium]
MPTNSLPRLIPRPEGAFAAAPRPVRIARIVQENYRIRSYLLAETMPHAYPGQFVMAWLPGIGEKPFSMAGNAPIKLTLAAVGKFSEAVHTLDEGETLWIRGPFGRGFSIEGERPLLVGGGYGAAPIAWLAETLWRRGKQPVVVLGGRTADDIFGTEPFDRMGIPVVVTTEDGSQGEAGRVTAPVERLLATEVADSLCAVGPHGMLKALEAAALAHRIPAQLSWEAFMGCAIGLCGMCEHEDGSLLCVEGPVLDVATRNEMR